ncbi:hypothetical protein [Streptomyces sp. NPDC001205]
MHQPPRRPPAARLAPAVLPRRDGIRRATAATTTQDSSAQEIKSVLDQAKEHPEP